ncbi:MAG: spermidine synthase, partial [Verrucomicrobiae bacterium]|nr:spermidine synthase [Verrucomicrobiae bacterium]
LKGANWDVAVGGLGLGYTAAAALEHAEVASLTVIELFPQVIAWHRKRLVPLGSALCGDERCRLIERDFFAAAMNPDVGLDPENHGRKYHAILLDIDHTPSHQLDSDNESFYTVKGLTTLAANLHEGGIFGLWSDDPPDAHFTGLLEQVFAEAEAIVVHFYNPIQDKESRNTVYLAMKA